MCLGAGMSGQGKTPPCLAFIPIARLPCTVHVFAKDLVPLPVCSTALLSLGPPLEFPSGLPAHVPCTMLSQRFRMLQNILRIYPVQLHPCCHLRPEHCCMTLICLLQTPQQLPTNAAGISCTPAPLMSSQCNSMPVNGHTLRQSRLLGLQARQQQ